MGQLIISFEILICKVYLSLSIQVIAKSNEGKTHITTDKNSNYFVFVSFFSPFTGCEIQAGSSARGRCSHWWSGGGSNWSPCRLQSGRNCSCSWWWDFGFHRWKIDTEKKTKNAGAGLFQLSRAFSPKCQEIQLKYSFITRNRSVVATLMTDLQPYALNTRLSSVNFDNSTVT